MKKEKVHKQGMYDDYINRNSEYARKSGSREPYHLTYARKQKEAQNRRKT